MLAKEKGVSKLDRPCGFQIFDIAKRAFSGWLGAQTFSNIFVDIDQAID